MLVAEGDAIVAGVGVKKIILIAPSSGTGESTFFPVKRITIMIITKRKIVTMMPVAATVLVLSSIPIV